MQHYSACNGLRFVRPYYHNYIANAKLRWFGRSCFDVYTSEFKNIPPDHYYQEIVSGRMQLVKNPNSKKHYTIYKGKQLFDDVKIGPGDKILHRDHVHEPPVLDPIPTTIYEDENYIVVNKPAGIPVHPVGVYFYNTIQEILHALRPDIKELYPIHRLDKVTSYVQMFGKNHEATSRFKGLIKNKHVQKTYLALVKGLFAFNDKELLVCKDPVVYIYGSRKSVKQFSPATTVFKNICYNKAKDESLVECKPLSGFSHQIRIHLRNLGFPIIDDLLYMDKYSTIFKNSHDVTSQYLNMIYKFSCKQRAGQERDANKKEERCSECGTLLYKDPKLSSLSIKLHSWKYVVVDIQSQKTYKFEARPPQWASEALELPSLTSNACQYQRTAKK